MEQKSINLKEDYVFGNKLAIGNHVKIFLKINEMFSIYQKNLF